MTTINLPNPSELCSHPKETLKNLLENLNMAKANCKTKIRLKLTCEQ